MQKFLVALAASSILVSGCGTSVVVPAKAPVTYAPAAENGDVQEAVNSSLRYLKWKVLEQGDGFVLAEARHKKQKVTAKISYDATSYSIGFVDSEYVKDGIENPIWKRWSHALDSDIRIGLGLTPLSR